VLGPNRPIYAAEYRPWRGGGHSPALMILPIPDYFRGLLLEVLASAKGVAEAGRENLVAKGHTT